MYLFNIINRGKKNNNLIYLTFVTNVSGAGSLYKRHTSHICMGSPTKTYRKATPGVQIHVGANGKR